MDSSVASPSLPSPPPPLRRKLAQAGFVVFCLYVVSLYVLALDQQFHWGLFPTQVEKQLTAQVQQLGDPALSAEKHQALSDDIVSWNSFAVPVLIKAIESGPPAGRDAAAQCLQQISLKFYKVDLAPMGTDAVKLHAWWDKMQADWAKAESEQK